MANPDASPEALITWAQIGGAAIVGAAGGFVWVKRFFTGRKEPAEQATSMVLQEAFSTPGDPHGMVERIAKATEDTRDLIRQLLDERANERRVEKEMKADHDRQDLIRMIAELKADITKRGG